MPLDVKEIKQRSVAGVLSYIFRTGFVFLIGIVATVLLGAYLTVEEFGVYFVVTAAIGVLTFISDVGLAATLVQKKDEPTIEELRTTFTVQQALAVVIFLITVCLTPFWKTHSHLDRSGLELLYVLGFSFFMASFKTIPSILLERKLEFSKKVIPEIVESVLFYGITVYLAAHHWGVRSYTIAVLTRSIAGVAVMYWIQRWPFGFAWSRSTFSRLIRFGAKFQLNDLLARIKDDLFVVVLNSFLPLSQMGLIGWAKRWSMYPYQFSVTSVVSIAFPTFSRLQDHPDLLKKALEKVLFFISLLIFPLLTGMVLMALPITTLLPQYQKWQPALPSLAFFCLNIAFAALANPIINTLNAIGKINRTLLLMIVMTLATWGLTPILIHFFGTIGVSMAAAIVASLSLFVLFEIKKVVSLNFVDAIWRQGLATFIMGSGLWVTRFWWMYSWRGLVLAIIAGVLLYATTLLCVGFEKVKQEVIGLFSK